MSLRLGVGAVAAVVLAACGSSSTAATQNTPQPTPSATAQASASPSPSPSPSVQATPTQLIPPWAQMNATCTGQPAAHEALLVMRSSPAIVLADVADATHPKPLCTLSGAWTPELVTQRMISWAATENPATVGHSMLLTLDMFTGVTTVLAQWAGGLYLDGLHGWSPDESSLAYVTSDADGVNLHLLSGGGDRSIATLGAVPARSVDPDQDDRFLGFSADGTYFALVQTFTSSGAQLQIRKTKDGTLAYSQPTGTMAAWSTAGSSLYFREPNATTIREWSPSGGVTQLFGLAQSWLKPSTDAGDDDVAYTVKDSSGDPHTWIYGHGGRSGGQLGNVRTSQGFLNSTAILLVNGSSSYTYDIASQSETPSDIQTLFGAWPRIGQT